ncbi:MAG: glutathione S-transferase family protein [Pseudomonadota bacterium]
MFTPAKNATPAALSRPDRYVVYGWQRSYFTHKLTAALHFHQLPWEYRDKTAENADELRLRSGTHQIPVLHTPENWMIADTTPLLQLLDGRNPQRRLFPAGADGLRVQILEEYFDEWIARTTVHWRWNYPENHELLSMDAAHGDREAAQALVTWGGKVCRATGVSSEIQQRAAEEEYHRIMAAAEEQLVATTFLLGNRPTAVDCIVLAGLRAHFLYDPAPRKALEGRYPRVLEWCCEKADNWPGDGELEDLGENAFSAFVREEMANTYAAFSIGNRQALSKGARAFVVPMYGEDVSYLARPYIEQSRRMIADRIEAELDAQAQQSLRDWLGSAALIDCFF